MALLYRAARLHDRADTHVFTFVVTRSVTRDVERDVTSKELVCAHHKWAITFSRTDKVLGVYLVWRSASEGVRVYVDFTFTLLNRDHFSANEGFSGKQVKFTPEAPAQGSRNCIPVGELLARAFAEPRGEFQLELAMGGVRTLYSACFRLPAPPPLIPAALHGGRVSKLESACFTFGGYDWNLTLTPAPKEAGESRVGVFLTRLSGWSQQARVRYSVQLGGARSPSLEQLSDGDGHVPGWHARGTLHDYAYKGNVRCVLELEWVRCVVDLAVPLAPPPPAPPPAATNCLDRDNQAWSLRSDCHSERVRLEMVFADSRLVPRNHLRLAAWTARLLRGAGVAGAAGAAQLPAHAHYYAQDAADEGVIMETPLRVVDARAPGCAYLDAAGALRVQLEWADAYLLFQATYHNYDDVARLHNHQMRREIAALQAENYALERQLVSYQRRLARSSPDDERALSTDTEYA